MRTRIIGTATFATIFMLPLSLPQIASKASADGAINRLMRWTGYGWSVGYHACNDHGCGLRDGLPPVGNTAWQNRPAGPGKFELVDPVYPVIHSSGHAIHGHHHTPVVNHNHFETVPFSSVHGGSLQGGSVLEGEVFPSRVVPQSVEPSETFQPYRSAVPPKVPAKPSVKSQDNEQASPSDLESLPSPKGEEDDLDDLMLEDSSVRLVPPRNRSAQTTRISRAR